MKTLIGIAAFVTIGLFSYTHEAPSAQADTGALSSPLVDSSLAVQPPSDFGCPWTTPFCCEPDENGGCYFCAGGDTQCP
jgi:hypothetical protein